MSLMYRWILVLSTSRISAILLTSISWQLLSSLFPSNTIRSLLMCVLVQQIYTSQFLFLFWLTCDFFIMLASFCINWHFLLLADASSLWPISYCTDHTRRAPEHCGHMCAGASSVYFSLFDPVQRKAIQTGRWLFLNNQIAFITSFWGKISSILCGTAKNRSQWRQRRRTHL